MNPHTLPANHSADISPHNNFSRAKFKALQGAVADFLPEDLIWASGYLAGLARYPQPLNEIPQDSSQAELFTIFVATQTGNGLSIANNLVAAAGEANLNCQIINLREFKPSRLKTIRHGLFIISTHGDGDPPDDAEELFDFLENSQNSALQELRYAIFALGDSSYAYFCEAGRRLDKLLNQHGAKSFKPLSETDLAFEENSRNWIADCLQALPDLLQQNPDTTSGNKLPSTTPITTLYNRTNPYYAEVLRTQKICGRDSGKHVYHIELSLGDSGINYSPGDSLAIIPENPDPLIKEIGQLLALDLNEKLSRDGNDLSLGEMLRHHYEVSLLSHKFLTSYSNYLEPTNALTDVLAEENKHHLADYFRDNQVIDILRKHPAELTAEQWIGCLQPIQPRAYSISSSILRNPDELHLTVSQLNFPVGKPKHFGVASDFLTQEISSGMKLPVFLQPNTRFRLPTNGDNSVIMVGPGTGVAPFRAFIEERVERNHSGKNWLFFGSQHLTSDFLYQLEWLRYLRQGILSDLDVAFSRDQPQKIYVQDRMREKSHQLFNWLENGAYFYVCGDANRMAGDVHQALLEVIMKEGGISQDAAKDYLQEMKRQGRYLRDVY